MSNNFTTSRQNLAAVFLDYENLFYHVKDAYKDPPLINEVVHEIVRNLRQSLVSEMNLDPIIYRAYADFERLATNPQGSLYLMGVDTVNVLGTSHKNAADMRLCIDLMEVLYTRSNVEHYVLVAGDRDYIPIVQHLRRQARYVTAVSFRETLSGDLLEIIGSQNVREAKDLISPETRARLESHRDKWMEENPPLIKGPTVIGKINLDEINPKPAVKRVFAPFRKPSVPDEIIWDHPREVVNEKDRSCLQQLMLFVKEKHVHEVWLSPFLRTLTDNTPMLADYERKGLITNLEMAGAIRVIKREGDPNPFSVIIINYNHPDVVDMNE